MKQKNEVLKSEQKLEEKFVKNGVQKTISFVIPAYNEEEVLPILFEELIKKAKDLEKMGYKNEVVFVNDGSKDKTLEILKNWQPENLKRVVVNLSRNFGKEYALTAGIDHASGAAVVPLDADLQDPLEVVDEMIKKWESGFDVVIGKRVDRSSDSFAKRYTAEKFYQIINKLAEINIPENVGDFRLMDKKVVEVIKMLPEKRRFMKGLFAWAGYKTTYVEYTRPERAAGVTKLNYWKLWNLALEGITSFSIAPLKIWTYIGFLISIFSFGYGAFILIRTLIFGSQVPGYPSLLVSMMFLGGIQLMGIGIMGEYIGRIYQESKGRPVYVVDEVTRD